MASSRLASATSKVSREARVAWAEAHPQEVEAAWRAEMARRERKKAKAEAEAQEDLDVTIDESEGDDVDAEAS